MKLFTAIYNTEAHKGINYSFYAKNIKAARKYRKQKFSAKYVRIIEEEFVDSDSLDVARL